MAFTDHCDIFAAVHEDGINRLIGHVRRQRPSLFNYATAYVAARPELLCKAIQVHPIVDLRNNPKVTLVDPLPIPGTPFGLNFAVQLTGLQIDFHPGDQFTLPPELSPPLQAQRLAIKLSLCAGIGCPSDDLLERYRDVMEDYQRRKGREGAPQPPLFPLPTSRLNCFCLDGFATGGFAMIESGGQPYLEPFIDKLEIVDLEPQGLENSIECYIRTMLKLVVLPGLRILLKHAPLNLTQGATDLFQNPTNVVLSPMPVSASLPHNPSIDHNLLQAFIKATVN